MVRPCFSLVMQRAIMGDWVAWKPEIAPQATVTNIMDHLGRLSGCTTVKAAAVSSGMSEPRVNTMAPPMPRAMMMRQMPNTG